MQNVDAAFFVSIALALIALEAAVLLVLHLRGNRWLLTPELTAHLASGACLMAALRLATGNGSAATVIALLAASGAAHAAALLFHWRRRAPLGPAASEPPPISWRTASDKR